LLVFPIITGCYQQYLEESTLLENFSRLKQKNVLNALNYKSWEGKEKNYNFAFKNENEILEVETYFDIRAYLKNLIKKFSFKKLVKKFTNYAILFADIILLRNINKISGLKNSTIKNIKLNEEYFIDYKKWLSDKYQYSAITIKENFKESINNSKTYIFFHIQHNTKYIFGKILDRINLFTTTHKILSFFELKPIIIEKIKSYTICSLLLISIFFSYKFIKKRFKTNHPSPTILQNRINDLELQNKLLIEHNIQLINNFNNKYI
jgi:hypothetical protein